MDPSSRSLPKDGMLEYILESGNSNTPSLVLVPLLGLLRAARWISPRSSLNHSSGVYLRNKPSFSTARSLYYLVIRPSPTQHFQARNTREIWLLCLEMPSLPSPHTFRFVPASWRFPTRDIAPRVGNQGGCRLRFLTIQSRSPGIAPLLTAPTTYASDGCPKFIASVNRIILEAENHHRTVEPVPAIRTFLSLSPAK
jgi:hypothetical protein